MSDSGQNHFIYVKYTYPFSGIHIRNSLVQVKRASAGLCDEPTARSSIIIRLHPLLVNFAGKNGLLHNEKMYRLPFTNDESHPGRQTYIAYIYVKERHV